MCYSAQVEAEWDIDVRVIAMENARSSFRHDLTIALSEYTRGGADMMRYVATLLTVLWCSMAFADTTYPLGGNVVALQGNGLQLRLVLSACIPSGSMCLGHSTGSQPAEQAAINCTDECCSNSAFGLKDSVDVSGNHTATGTCGDVVGIVGLSAVEPHAVDYTTQFVTVAKGAQTFSFGSYAYNTIFMIDVTQQPTSPNELCVVSNGFGGLGQPNPTIVVDCDFIFVNGFELPQ
jgi:hypothetical protein